MQYSPGQIYNGSDYQAYTSYTVGEWVKLTVEVDQQIAKVFIGDVTSVP
jgi:hypothetical protein